MTWLPYGILAVLLASVIFEYRLKHVDKDGRTVAHRRTRRIVLAITIFSILAQQGVAEIKERRRSKAEATLRGKVDKLLLQQSELLSALSTNNAIDPKLQVEILEHGYAVVELASADASDLDQWKADFKNEQAAAKQRDQAARLKHQILLAEQGAAAQGRVDRTWKRATQFYDFIIRTLQEKIEGIAQSRGEKVFSDYTGLPPAPVAGKIISVATITTGTNLGWSFEISAEAIPRGDSAEVWLRVFASCTNHADKVLYNTMFKSSEISGNPGTTNVNIESHLMVAPTHSSFSESINLETYQTSALAWVHRFIAARAIRCDEDRVSNLK